jgi:hypothetical protein
VVALELSTTLLQVVSDSLHIVRENDVTGLLPPHDDVILTYGALYILQACPDHNWETKVRMFL